MSIRQAAARGHFRTQTVRTPPAKVDRERNVIFGAKLIEEGPLNDSRPWHVDTETLEQAKGFIDGSAHGLKARWTHPNLSSDGLGKFAGRWKDARIEGGALVADLHISKSAFSSPSGDIGNYLLDLAEEDPSSFGVSLATKLDEAALFDSEGFAIEGPLRFAGLRAGDFVDDPAATRGGLFEIDDQRDLNAVASNILDHHFSEAEPEVVVERLRGFLTSYYGVDVLSKDQEKPEVKPEAPAAPEAPKAVDFRAEAKPYVEKFGDQGAAWYLEGKSLLECYEQHSADLAADRDRLAAELEKSAEDLASVKLGEAEGVSSEDLGSSEKPKSLAGLVNFK